MIKIIEIQGNYYILRFNTTITSDDVERTRFLALKYNW